VFERFTEKARRVTFFARYEASQYGSPVIETEHLLLWLLREDGLLASQFLRPNTTAAEFRTQIETQGTQRQRISNAVEVPLSAECKKILLRAKEESDNLRDRHIGTEHLLLAMLGSPTSLAARLLIERGAAARAIREQIAKTAGPGNVKELTAQGEKYRVREAPGGS
jgi:ATP-dependent Clp protease ATP-binding subunit ClpC